MSILRTFFDSRGALRVGAVWLLALLAVPAVGDDPDDHWSGEFRAAGSWTTGYLP